MVYDPSAACNRSPRRSGARPTSKVPRLAFVNKMDRVGADFLCSARSSSA